MPEGTEEARSFADQFDFAVTLGDGNPAFFGRNVLKGLTDGIDDFIRDPEGRWKRTRSLGPALLGSAMWIDDPELIERVEQLSGASVVISEQGRGRRDREKLERLHRLNEKTHGLPTRAFPDLGHLAPKVEGRPAVLGPNSRSSESCGEPEEDDER